MKTTYLNIYIYIYILQIIQSKKGQWQEKKHVAGKLQSNTARDQTESGSPMQRRQMCWFTRGIYRQIRKGRSAGLKVTRLLYICFAYNRSRGPWPAVNCCRQWRFEWSDKASALAPWFTWFSGRLHIGHVDVGHIWTMTIQRFKAIVSASGLLDLFVGPLLASCKAKKAFKASTFCNIWPKESNWVNCQVALEARNFQAALRLVKERWKMRDFVVDSRSSKEWICSPRRVDRIWVWGHFKTNPKLHLVMFSDWFRFPLVRQGPEGLFRWGEGVLRKPSLAH